MNNKKLIFEQYKKKAEKSVRKIGKFFGVQPPKFEIKIVDDREEFNYLIRKLSTPRWLVGMCLQGKFPVIVLLHPDVVANEGVHSREHMECVLIHEVAHLVFKQIYPLSEPFWLKEGIAVYLSGQYRMSRYNLKAFFREDGFPFSLTIKEQWEKLSKFGAYGIAGKFIEFLIRKFGKRSFNLWVQSLPKEKFYQDSFSRQFELFYKKPLVLTGKKFLNSLRAKD